MLSSGIKPQNRTVNSSSQCEQECSKSGPAPLKEGVAKKTAQREPVENTSWGLYELFEMQTEFALCQSMARSKTLTIMVCLGVLGYGGFILFLLKMAS